MKYRLFFVSLIAVFSVTLANLANILADDDKYTRLSLSVTETIEVEEDMLIANMQYEHEAAIAREVQNAINKRVKQAKLMADKVPEVKFSTEHYNIYKYHPNRRRNDPDRDKYVWRGSQSISMKSMDSDKLLKLAGDMQDIGLLMKGLNFVVSPGKYEEAKDSLLEVAIIKLKSKAERAARALGKQKIEFININVDNNYRHPQPLARNYSMSADMAKEAMHDPVAAPGQASISLTVSAVVKIDN